MSVVDNAGQDGRNNTPLNAERRTLRRLAAFCGGALIVLLVLALFARIERRGPACGEGLGAPQEFEVWNAYEATIYGWPVAALRMERIACAGSGAMEPAMFLQLHPLGAVISGLQLLVGGLLALALVERLVGPQSASGPATN